MSDFIILNSSYVFFWMVLISFLFGSFLNVLITRLPIMLEREYKLECYEYLGMKIPKKYQSESSLNLFFPNSHCLSCKKDVRWWDNIPILSYLILGGKCRNCDSKIPFRYFLVETITPILSILVLLEFGISDKACYALLFTWGLIALSFIDIENTILPDQLTLSLLWFGIFVNLSGNFISISSAVLGAIFGYLILLLIYLGFKTITGKEGLGFGDFKLLAMLGAWVGWTQLPLIIFISSLLGTLFAVPWLLVTGSSKNTPIPFGPFLSLSGFVSLLYGESIQKSYVIFLNVII